MLVMTEEFKKKCNAAKSADELAELVKGQGKTISKEQAEKYFAAISVNGEMSDEELDSVAGGGCGQESEAPTAPHAAKFKVGDKVLFRPGYCNICSCDFTSGDNFFRVEKITSRGSTPDDDFVSVRCSHCNMEGFASAIFLNPYTGKL